MQYVSIKKLTNYKWCTLWVDAILHKFGALTPNCNCHLAAIFKWQQLDYEYLVVKDKFN